MTRISCVLILALALTSCGEQDKRAEEPGDTAGQQADEARVSFNVVFTVDKTTLSSNTVISGSFENATAASVVISLDQLANFFGPLHGYEVTNKLAGNSQHKFAFTFELRTLADLKELLEKELNVTVTLDEKAKTLTVE